MRVVLDGVFNHTGRGFWPFHHVLETGGRLAVSRLVPPRSTRPRRPAAPLTPYPPPDAPTERARATRHGGACRPCPSSTPTSPAVREYLLRRRRALAAVRDRRLAPGRPGRDRRRGVLAGVPARAAGRSGPTPTWSARSGTSRRSGCSATGFDALMNYPLAEAILGFAGGPSLDMGVVRAHHEYAGIVRAARRARVRGAARRAAAASTTRDASPSSSTCSARTTRRGCGPSWAASVARVRLATLLQATLPGRAVASTTATRSA